MYEENDNVIENYITEHNTRSTDLILTMSRPPLSKSSKKTQMELN